MDPGSASLSASEQSRFLSLEIKQNISGQAMMGNRFDLLSSHDSVSYLAPFPYLR